MNTKYNCQFSLNELSDIRNNLNDSKPATRIKIRIDKMIDYILAKQEAKVR